jgi:hypothetical protein
MYFHAASRWAKVTVGAIDCEADPKTLMAWGQAVGVSCGALRIWCRAAGVAPRDALYFCRMLRAMSLRQVEELALENILDVIDQRTLRKLLTRAGLRGNVAPSAEPNLLTFITRQTFVTNPNNIEAVLTELRRRGKLPRNG